MFKSFRKEDTELDAAITYIYAELRGVPSDDPRHQKMVDQLTKLYALKKKTVDPNTLYTVAGNIFIGLAVLEFERAGIVASKVWSFFSKL